MNRLAGCGVGKHGMMILVAALGLAAVSGFAQSRVDYDFQKKYYTAGIGDVFKVEVSLKNTAYWLLNDSLKSDKPIACDTTEQDCSPASFRLVEVIDTAKTDAFFKGHKLMEYPYLNILEYPDLRHFVSKPPYYASKYVVYITALEMYYFLNDTLVVRMVDLEPGLKTVASLGRGKTRAHGYRPFADYRTGEWLLGRNTGPRPDAFSSLP
ncbi:MAG: hypothetical protein JF616_20990 [Fibrobacteres bacterium]|nr:hypothetical protein [Fibrobacterota bacterium]